MNIILSDKDINQIAGRGQSVGQINAQIEAYRKGFPYLHIDRRAAREDGIVLLNDEDLDRYSKLYLEKSPGLRIVKFVPASGAATRMFKDLFDYVSSGIHNETSKLVAAHPDGFAFVPTMEARAAEGKDPVRAIMDYGAHLPKGLVAFHRYEGETRTAAEEHLVEGAMYAARNNKVDIHFTVSPEHEDAFRKVLGESVGKYEKRYGVKYNISFSHQDPSTDMIALTPENELFRLPDGSLLFRPAGHGALLKNLEAVDADVIFIKNIDNVATDRFKGDSVIYKTALAGVMLDIQSRMFDYLRILDEGADTAVLDEIVSFISSKLYYEFADNFKSLNEQERKKEIYRILNRPLRVCAMVQNQGEPGGGPFWVRNRDGSKSLQIVEKSQVSPEQDNLFRSGTHFNPVDIVCSVKDYKGHRFALAEYTDPETGLVSEKTMEGSSLKAQELPGLWNGSMANWNTVFVQAPITTFTPVKEIVDLLRVEHR